jgi:hypothetical protein
MIRRASMLLIGGVTAIVASGCGSDSADQQNPPADAAAQDASTLNFARITREVISKTNCGGVLCHEGTAAGFKLGTNDQLYPTLINTAASGPECAAGGMIRVVPNDPNNSLLYLKISATAPPCGDPMPEMDSRLAQDKIDLVRSWIEAGAPKD